MKTRPILFTGDMVRAILDGRKTQTRRVIKPQPMLSNIPLNGLSLEERRDEELHWLVENKCPYRPGQRLWVRETWQHESMDVCENAPNCGLLSHIYYRAAMTGAGGPDKWRPSIFMPRWASRITLEITGVRIERVQDISEADALAEGVPANDFRWLWDNINGERGYSWDTNPWVWVVRFRTVTS